MKPIKYGREWELTDEQLPNSAWLVAIPIPGDKIYVSEETGYVYLHRTAWGKLYRCYVDDYPKKK